MKRKSSISNYFTRIFSLQQLKLALYFFIVIIGYLLLVILPDSQAQSQDPCKADLANPRAGGLVSAGTFELGSRFYVTNQGSCIVDVGTASVSLDKFTIPSYSDLKNQYFTRTKALNKKTVDNYQAVFGDNTNGVYLINGNVDINTPTTYSKDVEETKIIFIEGNLNINYNIQFHSNNIDKPSGLVFIVRDNINIDESVTFIDAVLISFGEICTGSQSGICPTDTIKTQTLLIAGSLISLKPLDPNNPVSIKFVRDLGNNNTPAEKVIFQPKYLALLRDLMAEDLKITSEDTFFGEDPGYTGLDAAPTLPPSQSSGPPPGPDTEPPTTPPSLVATTASSTQINLTWGRSIDNYAVDGYNVYMSTVENGTYTKINTILISSQGFSVRNLSPNTTYFFYVNAQDRATPPNVSGQSNLASATTLQIASASVSVFPTTVKPGQQITITWKNISSPTSKDWLGLYPQGNTNSFGFLRWMYVSCGQTATVAKASGTCYMTLPDNLPPGSYEIRLLANDTFDKLIATSNIFKTESAIYNLSDLSWEMISGGWSPPEKDRAMGDEYIGDGTPISIRGTPYRKGIGVHPATGIPSDIRFNMKGECTSFFGEVGVDDSETSGSGDVVFQIWADGSKLFDSGRMTNKNPAKLFKVNVTGKQELKLIVTDGGDDYGWDHSVWANPKIDCKGTPTAPKVTASVTNTHQGAVVHFTWENFLMWRNYTGIMPSEASWAPREKPWEWVGLYTPGERDEWNLADEWWDWKYMRNCETTEATSWTATSGSCSYNLFYNSLKPGTYEIRIWGDWGSNDPNNAPPTFLAKSAPFYVSPQMTITPASQIFQKDTNKTLGYGLTSYYNLDETYGSIEEDLVADRHAYRLGGAQITTTAKKGVRAVSLDGGNDCLSPSYLDGDNTVSKFLSDTAGTVSLWVRPTGGPPVLNSSAGQDQWDGDVVFTDDWGSSGVYRSNYNGQDRFWFMQADNYWDDWIGVSYSVNTWTHLVWVHDNSNFYAYKNGVLAGSKSLDKNTTDWDPNQEFSFGGWKACQSSLEGQLDEISTWNRALNAQEISDLYNAGAANTFNIQDPTAEVTQTQDDPFIFVSWKGANDATQRDWIGLGQTSKDFSESFQVDPGQTLINNLLAYWKMDDPNWNGTGQIKDSTGNMNSGYNYSSGAITSPGKINLGAQFDGINDRLVFGDDPFRFSGNASFSVSLWFYRLGQQGGTYPRLVSKEGTGIMDWGISLGGSENQAYFTRGQAGLSGGNDGVTANNIAPYTWYHLTATYDGTTMKMYINGNLVNAGTSSIRPIGNTKPLTIGTNSDGNSPFDGKIDELGVWNRALTAAEVSQLYNSGTGNAYTNPQEVNGMYLDYRYTNCQWGYGSFAYSSGSCGFPINPWAMTINSGLFETAFYPNDNYVPVIATSNDINFSQSPFTGTAKSIASTGSTTVQIEDFDKGGQGVAYNDTEPQNYGGSTYRASGVDLQPTTIAGYNKAGEWLEYTINVASSGYYNIATQVASMGTGGSFHIEFDGVNKTGTLNIPNTNSTSWSTFIPVSKSGIYLTSGTHIMRLSMDTNGSGNGGWVGNFDYIQFSPGTALSVTCSPSSSVLDPYTNVTFTANASGGSQNYAYRWSGSDNLTIGTLTRELWTGLAGGTAVSTVPINTAPNSTDSLTWFESDNGRGDYYGQRVRGYITAPETGSYIFWIASDDESELWLSSDDQIANKQEIALVPTASGFRNWTATSPQKSASINLTAGQTYYVEALMKEEAGGDYLSVGWTKPSDPIKTTAKEVIPGSVLSPYISTTPTVTKSYSNPSSPNTPKTATVTVTDNNNPDQQKTATCNITVNSYSCALTANSAANYCSRITSATGQQAYNISVTKNSTQSVAPNGTFYNGTGSSSSYSGTAPSYNSYAAGSYTARFDQTVGSGSISCSAPAITINKCKLPVNTAYKRMFITSTTHTGSIGGLTGADGICQARATSASLGGTWKAWLSSSTVNAASRLTQFTTGQYKLIDDTPVANSWADLIDGILLYNIDIDETDNFVPSSPTRQTWTNTNTNGTRAGSTLSTTCSDWTSTSGTSRYGDGDRTDAQWTYRTGGAGDSNCTSSFRLYCIEQ